MSQGIKDFLKSMVSTNDLSAAEGLIVAVDTAHDGSVVAAAASTDPILGVLINKPIAGQTALVQWLGSAKVIAGGTIAAGDRVTSDSSGHAVTSTTNKMVQLGIALQSAVAGDLFEVFLGGASKQSF